MDGVVFQSFISGIRDTLAYVFERNYGDGNGEGNGHGSGYNSTSGRDSVDGYGRGIGDDQGNDKGNGDRAGHISYLNGGGYGQGRGDGSGSGMGSSSVDGEGDGFSFDGIYGADFGNGFILKKYKKQKVYYIDGIPCLPRHIRKNFAFVDVIGKDMRTSPMVIAKGHGLFAHGNTVREAVHSLELKCLSSIDFEAKKSTFLERFNHKEKYPVKDFFDWHGILTGSCEAGRLHFANERSIDVEKDMMTLDEFFSTVKGEYGWERIEEIKKRLVKTIKNN